MQANKCLSTCSRSCSASSPSRYSSNNSLQTSHFITNSSVRTDLLPHLRAGAVQISLQLRERETCNRGDLFVTALVHHLEREHQSLVFIEGGEGAPDQVVQLLAQQPFDRHRFVVAQIHN